MGVPKLTPKVMVPNPNPNGAKRYLTLKDTDGAVSHVHFAVIPLVM